MDKTIIEDAKAAGFIITENGTIFRSANTSCNNLLTKFAQLREARQSSQSEPVAGYVSKLPITNPQSIRADDNDVFKIPVYAAPQQAIPSVWQPIETAPKDGTEIDVWCFDSENEGYRVANAWYCNALNKWRSYGDNELIWANMPSYWMPLPASPTAPIERDK